VTNWIRGLCMGDTMRDDNKTKKQLVIELTELHSQNAELKKSITESISAELASEESSRYAESIVETVRGPLLILDGDLKILSANRNFYRTFKVIPAETIGCFIYDLGNKQWDIPKLRELLEEVLPEKEAFDDFEVDHDFQDIGHKIMLLNARRIYRKDIGAKMILLAIEDITERKRLESSLIDSEEQYRRLFETASDGIVLLEKREGKITHANPATEKLLGYTEKESVGNSLQDIGVSLDQSDFQTTMQNLNKSGILNYRNVKVETKSGQHIDTEIYLVDRAKLVQCNIRDITERKQTKERLRESEEKYRNILETIEEGYFEVDLTGSFTFFNPSLCRILGYSREEMPGMNNRVFMDAENAKKVFRAFNEVYATGIPRRGFEWETIRKDGARVYMEVSVSLIAKPGEKPTGFRGIARDVTDRRRAEDNLNEVLEKYRSLVTYVDSMYLVDRDCTYLFMNEGHLKRFGLSLEEVIGKRHGEFHSEEEARRFAEDVNEACETGKPSTKEHRSLKDGKYYLRTFTPIIGQSADKKISHVAVISKDISDIKLAEEKLKDTLKSLRSALDTTIQVMVSAVEIRDPYTAGHQIRSAHLASAIATEIGLSQEKIEGIRMAGSIHDIGKLSIPAEILSKPTKLSDIEFRLIKEHASKGYEMLKDVESPWPLAEIVYQHHERMDGSGYPRNLKGDEICIEARILAVADVVEAMASHRPYRPGLGIDAALNEIEKNRGIIYDTVVADVCLRLFREKGFQLEGA
jgi:PAS domain S-box-containing protein/putative nucleotidyltransferase with HDIG domain